MGREMVDEIGYDGVGLFGACAEKSVMVSAWSERVGTSSAELDGDH